MDGMQMGKLLFFTGLIIMAIGAIWWIAGDKLNFLGNLPGDFKIEKDNVRFYFPLTTMVILSILLSLVVKLFQWLK